jgi:type I restriction enzyme S subunit
MKDSGVEWLGEIPAHWESSILGRAFVVDGGFAFRSEDFTADGVPVARMSNLKDGHLDLSDATRIPERLATKAFELQVGDLVIGMSGSLANYAWVKESDVPCQLNQRVGRIRERDASGHLRFAMYVLGGCPVASQVDILAVGTAQQNISSWQLEHLRVALSPCVEQRAIAAFLDRETARIDALVAKVREAIDCLKELRTALISAAVTGKIDVREEVA